jgi:hypothetical protein
MLLIHITLYASMLTLGFIVGILFPQMPWVPLWLFATFAVIGYRSAKLNNQRQMSKLVDAHKARMELMFLNNTGE